MEANKNILRTTLHNHKRFTKLFFSGLLLSIFFLNILSTSSLIIGSFQSTVSAAEPSIDATYVNFDTIEVKHGYTGGGLEQQAGRYLLTNDKDNSGREINGGRSIAPGGLLYTLDRNKDGRDLSEASCVPSILIKNGNLDDNRLPKNGKATLYLKKNDGNGSSSCVEVIKRDFIINNWSAGSKTFFNWKNADVLLPVGPSLPYKKDNGRLRFDSVNYRQFGAFVKQANGNYSNVGDSDRCKSFISNVTDTTGKINFHNGDDNGNCTDQYGTSFTVNLGLVENRNFQFDDPENGGADNDVTVADGQGGLSLECNVGLNPLNWLLCGAVKGMVNIVGQLDNLINSLLSVGSDGNSDDPSQIFGSNSNGKYSIQSAQSEDSSRGYYKAWATMRNIALGLMAIIGLIIIISQALGTELLDAYTIKKALPRFIIAALAIALSWQLLQFMVTLTNQLGFGIRYLMFEPFVSGGFNADLALGGGETVAVSLISAGAIAALGIFGLLSFAATAALAVFVAFLILVLRQIIIIILIIFAPIAIAAYVLPNTNKFYKIWWESLEKALLMFPLIAAMIAAGRIFSAVALSGPDDTPIQELIGFAAYFAPYFAIPFALKFAGGALATIGGFANNANRGAFDRLKNYRGNQVKQRTANAGERARTGNTFKRAPVGSLRDGLNRGIQGTSLIGQAGFDPRNMRTNLRTAMNDSSEARVEKFRKENTSFNSWANDDAKLSAARYTSHDDIGAELSRFDGDRFAGNANAARREEAISQIRRSQKQVDNATFQKARVRNQATTGTGYQYTDANGQTQFDASRMLDDINEVYGNDRNGAGKALAEMRSSLSQSGQIAGMAGYGTWAGALEGRHNGTVTGQDAHNTIMDDAINAASPGQAIYGKPASAAAMGAAHARRINRMSNEIAAGNSDYTIDDLSAAVAGAAGIYDAMSQASPANASAMANELMGVEIQNGPSFTIGDTTFHPRTVREYITTQMNGNAAFADRRRDLGQSTLAEARAQQQRQQQPGLGGLPGGTPGGPPIPPV